jgi:hypothetical protein
MKIDPPQSKPEHELKREKLMYKGGLWEHGNG